MSRYLALATAAIVVLAACADDDAADPESPDATEAPDTTEPDSPDTTEAPDTIDAPGDTDPAFSDEDLDPAELERAPGVTDDTIKIGVTYVDLEAVRDVTDTDQGDFEAAYTAVIDDINDRGGIHGRMLEPVFAPVDPRGTAPADEACLRLTQDEEVFVTVGFFLSDTMLCYVETNNAAVIGGGMSEERLERAEAPWFSLGTGVGGSDLEADSLRALAEAGMLDGDVAVFALDQDADQFERVAVPLLEELGVNVVSTGIVDAPPDDIPGTLSRTLVVMERFQADGADTVVTIGQGDIGWLQGLEETDYRPQTIFATPNTPHAYLDTPGADPSLLEGTITGDAYGPDSAIYNEPKMQDCLALLDNAGIDIPDPATIEPDDPSRHHVSAFAACQNLALLEAIVDAAGQDLNYATFRAAGYTVGDMDMPGAPDPYNYGSPPSADGDPTVYLYEWDADASDFVILD